MYLANLSSSSDSTLSRLIAEIINVDKFFSDSNLHIQKFDTVSKQINIFFDMISIALWVVRILGPWNSLKQSILLIIEL